MRETDILDLIRASLLALSSPDSVTVHLHSELADTAVRLDRERVERMLSDLMKNALEAMPGGGDLTVAVAGGEAVIAITVEDTGRGMSPEEMDQLFTPFFTTKPVGEGTGLGLPSVYATVKAHGGRISVESNADPQKGPTGTKIRVTLPRRSLLDDPKTRLILHDD